jgi:histidinol-phosphatase
MTSGFEWWPPTLRLLADRAPCTMRTWGDGYGYSLVATGRVDAMLDPEAAGRLTGLDGSPGVASGSALASNGLVHDELLAHFAGA